MKENNSEEKLGLLNILVLFLSMYVLGTLLVDAFMTLPVEVSRMISITDHIICIFFLLEFSIRFYRAENKLLFMKWGWIDLLASIPAVEYLRAGRLFRVIRIIRVIRGFRSTRHLVHHIFRNKATGAFTSIFVVTLLFFLFSVLAMLIFERQPNSTIKTTEDAFWWAYSSLTSTNLGSFYPVSTEGRIIGGLLKLVGMGLVGTFIGYAASWFMGEKVNN